MQNNLTTSQSTNPHGTVRIQPPPAEKLEAARRRLRHAACQIQTSEGRVLDYDTAEDLQRSLSAIARTLEELTVTLSVLQRREAHNG